MSDTELTVPDALQLALKLHRSGRVGDAFQIYRRVLEVEPEQPDALHYMGVLAHQQGNDEQAFMLIEHSVALVPSFVGFRSNFGNLLVVSGRFAEAEEQYKQALAIDADHVDALNNYGVLCKGLRRFDESERLLLRVIELEPDFVDARNNLASLYATAGRIQESIEQACEALIRDPKATNARQVLGLAYYRLGKLDEAVAVYRAWLAEEPGNPFALHHLAACTGENVPPRAADEYVRSQFDGFSRTFDAKLAVLQYRAPSLVADAVCAGTDPNGELDAVDAGCGTGLCGPLLRAYCRRLVGVDLSPGMLAEAKRRGVYDELVECELTAYLQPHVGEFDLIVSADTLVYFGVLDDALRAAALALRAGGRLCFTVEALDETSSENYRLLPHGRYAHAKRYLIEILSVLGLTISRLDSVVLRYEGGEQVKGWLVLAERAASAW